MKEEGRRMRDERSGKMDGNRANKIRTVRNPKVYRKAFDAAMEIFELTKKFPKAETYSLTDQMLYAMEKKADAFCRPSSYRSLSAFGGRSSVFHRSPPNLMSPCAIPFVTDYSINGPPHHSTS
jgi:hypothetical protein